MGMDRQSVPASLERDVRAILAHRQETGQSAAEAIAALFDLIDEPYRLLLLRAVEHVEK
jgi:hypothetical protein